MLEIIKYENIKFFKSVNETNCRKDKTEERIVHQKIVWGFTKITTGKTGKITHTHIHVCTYTQPMCIHTCMRAYIESSKRPRREKLRYVNICLLGIPQTRGKKRRAIFNKGVAEIFPESNICPQVKHKLQPLSKINKNKPKLN